MRKPTVLEPFPCLSLKYLQSQESEYGELKEFVSSVVLRISGQMFDRYVGPCLSGVVSSSSQQDGRLVLKLM